MRALLLVLSIFISSEAFSLTSAEKDEILRRRERAKRLSSIEYTPVSSENCDDATTITKSIQKLVLEAKYGDGEEAKSLSDLERQYQAKKSEMILYSGIDKLNNEYKDFLSSVAGVNGWKSMEGITREGGFSLDKLKADLQKSREHMKNVETMAFMDQLLKESIEDHENLADPAATKSAIENSEYAKSQAALGMPLIHNRTSGSKTFEQLETHCAQPQTKKLLCKILDNSTDEGKSQIKATLVGFVDAYRMSKRGDIAKALTSNIVRDDLQKYRERLLVGIEDATAEKLKVEIKEYKENNEDLKKIAELDPSKIEGMISDINNYQACISAEALNGKPGSEECQLAKTESQEYVKSLNQLADVQHDVVQKLGGNNETIKLRMDKVHNHIKTKENLIEVQKLYAGQPEFKKLIAEKIENEKMTIKEDVGGILNSVLAKTSNSELALELRGGKSADSFQKFLQGNGSINLRSSKERLEAVNEEINQKMSEVRCSHNPAAASTEDPDLTTISQCEEAKNDMRLFKVTGDKLDIDPSQLENYLKELNEGHLAQNTKDKLASLSKEMDELKAAIDGIRGSKKHDTLNQLLAHYSNKAKVSCKGHADKELIQCSATDKESNENITALVDSAGKILSSMPNSPGSLAISELNNNCNTKFMNSFSEEDQKIVNPICDSILQENEAYAESLKPTQEEIKDKKQFTYWDGTKIVSETRQRNRWMVTQAVAEGAIEFLPSFLDHQIKKTGIESWEASTIEGIKYRNGMLENYYTYGIYGYNGYFGGSPDYLSNWGGSVYNNGFQTTGAGGYFAYTEPAAASTNIDPTTGFSF